MFVILAAIFFGMVALSIMLVARQVWLLSQRKRPKGSWKVRGVLLFFYGAYFLFAIFGTGPRSDEKPRSKGSSYVAPWPGETQSCVAQGVRSLVSHRGQHLYAWDFVRPLGSPVLAAREGKVVAAEDSQDGIGWFEGNHIIVEHKDGTRALYAHIAKDSARFGVGDAVRVSDRIASIGMVGKTIFPHLHFVVMDSSGNSMAIAFRDVGFPLAGSCYRTTTSTP